MRWLPIDEVHVVLTMIMRRKQVVDRDFGGFEAQGVVLFASVFLWRFGSRYGIDRCDLVCEVS